MTAKANHYGHYDLEGYDSLETLALDLIWSWNSSADHIWRQVDADLFEATRNPWLILQTVSREKLKTILADATFRKMVDTLLQKPVQSHNWFEQTYPKAPLQTIAYFSMEFMLSEALPIYSGGLGNVAGDQLKAASDLGVPVVGVGLLYQQGYFRQIIDDNGAQQAAYPYNSPGQLPIIPLRKSNGEWLRIEIHMPGWSLWIRAWQVKVGRVTLYLLDTNDAANNPVFRGITSELYGGDIEMRLKQELVLGIGGWRLLEEIGMQPEVCHLNEGHAAFAILERAKACMREMNLSFYEALAVTRAGNLFTTHTAVPAGFDRFSPQLIAKYLTGYAENALHISMQELLDLGRQDANDDAFNMAYLAVRGSGAVNGVSRLHGYVSRRIFSSLFPRWPVHEVPIGHVTNGVHMPSWESDMAEALWDAYTSQSRWLGEAADLEENLKKVPDEKIWAMRNMARLNMIEYGRKRLPPILAARGKSPEEIEQAKSYFNPHALTLGFARRFATYKRPNMLLHDQARLIRLLTNPDRPVQLLIAGKAHPADKPGQAMIQEWFQFIHQPEVRPHVIFLSDYDMLMAETLVQGVDVWINTPRRPWEACGTSGMKVLVNGGLNLSELDGWWAEAYTPEVGWALGDGQEHREDEASWDAHEALQLYDILEKEVIPTFYERNHEGIPTSWIARVRESMARLTPAFCANRSVRDYTTNHYIPAAENFQKRAANQADIGKKINIWNKSLQEKWPSIQFKEIKITPSGSQYTFEIQIDLKTIDPSSVKLEIYAEGNIAFKQEMKQISGSSGVYLYQAEAPNSRPSNDYCARVIACFPEVSVPLEAPFISWQR
jgi:starch phosphorylase